MKAKRKYKPFTWHDIIFQKLQAYPQTETSTSLAFLENDIIPGSIRLTEVRVPSLRSELVEETKGNNLYFTPTSRI